MTRLVVRSSSCRAAWRSAPELTVMGRLMPAVLVRGFIGAAGLGMAALLFER